MLRAISLLALCALATGTQCPPLGSVNFLIPHETDCSKFYICAHGSPVLQSCPEGTHFSAIFMNCQSPYFAGCATELPESDYPCNWPSSVVLRPHPHSCNKYYVCEYGQVHVFNCPEGLEFNAELQKCLWPHESNCSSHISQHSQPNVQVDVLQNGGSAQDGRQLNIACQSGATFTHDNCSKYYICDHGILAEMECPLGLQWNSTLEQCVWPRESDCTFTPQKCIEGALFAHEDCNKYIICNYGKLVVKVCPPGLQWNSKDEQCVWPRESDCTSTPQKCLEGALFAHEDCNKYIICNYGKLVVKVCPPGLQWNSKDEICDWPRKAGCVKNKT